MIGFWIVFTLALTVVVGNALVLLRTARKPEPPRDAAPLPEDEEPAG